MPFFFPSVCFYHFSATHFLFSTPSSHHCHFHPSFLPFFLFPHFLLLFFLLLLRFAYQLYLYFLCFGFILLYFYFLPIPLSYFRPFCFRYNFLLFIPANISLLLLQFYSIFLEIIFLLPFFTVHLVFPFLLCFYIFLVSLYILLCTLSYIFTAISTSFLLNYPPPFLYLPQLFLSVFSFHILYCCFFFHFMPCMISTVFSECTYYLHPSFSFRSVQVCPTLLLFSFTPVTINILLYYHSSFLTSVGTPFFPHLPIFRFPVCYFFLPYWCFSFLFLPFLFFVLSFSFFLSTLILFCLSFLCILTALFFQYYLPLFHHVYASFLWYSLLHPHFNFPFSS